MRKMAIAISLFAVLIVAGVGIYALFLGKNTTPSDIHNSPSVSIPPQFNKEKPEENSALLKEGDFSIRYPTFWKLRTGSSNEVFEYIIKPEDLSDSDTVPSLSVYVYKDAQDYITSRIDRYMKNGYKKENVTLGGLFGVKLSGEIGYYTKNGNVVNNPVQDTIYFLNKGQNVIEVHYKYLGDHADKNQEEFFNSYVSTFSAQ